MITTPLDILNQIPGSQFYPQIFYCLSLKHKDLNIYIYTHIYKSKILLLNSRNTNIPLHHQIISPCSISLNVFINVFVELVCSNGDANRVLLCPLVVSLQSLNF